MRNYLQMLNGFTHPLTLHYCSPMVSINNGMLRIAWYFHLCEVRTIDLHIYKYG